MFCTECGARMEPGTQFCVACGYAADVVPPEFSAAQENATFREGDGTSGVEERQPPMPAAYEAAEAPQIGRRSGGAGKVLLTAALGAMLFAALGAALSIFAIRATAGVRLFAALDGNASDTVAVVVGGAERGAFFSDYALIAVAALCALLLFNIIMLNTARTRRAFLCIGAAAGAAGLALTAAGLLFDALRELPVLADIMDWPVFGQFGDDAGVQFLRSGLAALAVSAPALAAYLAARAARPGTAARRSGGHTLKFAAMAVVSAAIAAACGWFAYMAFAA